MNSNERPIPDPAPKPTGQWGLDTRKNSYELAFSHLLKYVRIGRGIAIEWHVDGSDFDNWLEVIFFFVHNSLPFTS